MNELPEYLIQSLVKARDVNRATAVQALAEYNASQLASTLREMADEITANAIPVGAGDPPDFFQPRHTYHHMPWTFRCIAVAPNPETSEPRALGFSSRSGIWVVSGLDPDDWAEGCWTDITGTTRKDVRP